MPYMISFLEGIITFISPCLLPMLPIYISYFAGGRERTLKRTLTCALGFVLGFTAVFVAMGALAGTVGSFLTRYQTAVNVTSGLIVIFFGLNFLGVFKLNLFRGSQRQVDTSDLNFWSSALFGLVFSVGWTPCVGAFLGSALMLASQQGSVLVGTLMLLCYSAGLGIPFLLSAVLSKLWGVQTISYDKVNQLRHVRYLKDKAHTLEIMKRLAAFMAPKFQVVKRWLAREIAPLDIANWNDPKGGYFVSLNAMPGTAKRTLALCLEAGVEMTPAGATFPHGTEPADSNIRIAPSLPPLEELEQAMEVFCTCLKLAALEKLLAE